jgi:hypothetical protein
LRPGNRPILKIEILESRTLLSAASHLMAEPLSTLLPAELSAAPGYSPAKIRHAYGFDQVLLGSFAGDGSGQTIAIIGAYNQPNIVADLTAFDSFWHIAAPPNFNVVNQTGGTALPAQDFGWGLEESLDVEWAHALAPGANIILIEANSATYTDLFGNAVNWARQQPSVSVISMSFGGSEFSGETAFDSTFTTPLGHQPISFVAASGDYGAPPSYPAVSPNVLSAGGTHLNIDAQGNYLSESGWSGSGGGVSAFEQQPTYQQGFQSTGFRTNPDVAFDADPSTGVGVVDSYGYGGWVQVGGTSLAAPAWASVLSIVNQGRSTAGLGNVTQTPAAIYALPASDFNDITTGNNGFQAHVGYDLVTGRGSPKAAKVIQDLAGVSPTTNLPSPTGGSTFTGTPTKPAQGSPVTGMVQMQFNNLGITASPSSFAATAPLALVPPSTNAAKLPSITAPSLATGAATVGAAIPTTLTAGYTGSSSSTWAASSDGTDDFMIPLPPDEEINVSAGSIRLVVPECQIQATEPGLPINGLFLVTETRMIDEALVGPDSFAASGPYLPTALGQGDQARPEMLAGLLMAMGGFWASRVPQEEKRQRPKLAE